MAINMDSPFHSPQINSKITGIFLLSPHVSSKNLEHTANNQYSSFYAKLQRYMRLFLLLSLRKLSVLSTTPSQATGKVPIGFSSLLRPSGQREHAEQKGSMVDPRY